MCANDCKTHHVNDLCECDAQVDNYGIFGVIHRSDGRVVVDA